jgi:inosose dehydratase
MERVSDLPMPSRHAVVERLAGAPISWGACEVPGWGPMPAADAVLSEMAQLGLRGTELGAPGFLPSDPSMLARTLGRHGLELVGAFLPLVLHEPSLGDAARLAGDTARRLADAGGQVLVMAVVQDLGWSTPRELDDEGWRRLAAHADEIAALAAEHGVTAALHPHAGTLIETSEQIERALSLTELGWCLDTGHLLIGDCDPTAFARDHGDRVVHVHLKDVDATVAAQLRGGTLSLLEATRQGMFRPLGQGDVGIAAVLEALEAHEYDGWLVLEQDTASTADESAVASAPMFDAQQSIAFLHNPARMTEEVNQ